MDTKIKMIVPSDIIEEISNLEGFNVSETIIEQTNEVSHPFDLSLMDPHTLATTGITVMSLIGFLSNVNGAVTLIEKIRKYFDKHKDSDKKIRVVTHDRTFVIDAVSTPELYEKMNSYFTQQISRER